MQNSGFDFGPKPDYSFPISAGNQSHTFIPPSASAPKSNVGMGMFATSFIPLASDSSSNTSSFSTTTNTQTPFAFGGGFNSLDDDDDFGFGDIEKEIIQMEEDKKQRDRDQIFQNSNKIFEDATSKDVKGFAPLPSQSADSLAFHNAVLESMGKKFAASNSKGSKARGKLQAAKKKDPKAIQKAEDAKDKLQARLGGDLYKGAVRNSRQKAKRNHQY